MLQSNNLKRSCLNTNNFSDQEDIFFSDDDDEMTTQPVANKKQGNLFLKQ
jgi:hypothetical protein